MGRASVKANKTPYQKRREELGYSREKASEVLVSIPADRIEKIENERTLAHPEEILVMAEGYRSPEFCNYYCANECPIGKRYVPEVKVKDLSKIVLEILASLNAMQKKQENLIEIASDDKIGDDEIEAFIQIRENLEKISVSISSLRLWSEQMLASGKINEEKYKELVKKLRK